MYASEDEELGDLPEIELIDGVEVPKMSPRRRHAVLQTALASLLREWARGKGEVGTEWRFHVSGVPGRRNSYVPDIAFVRYERLEPLSAEAAEEPPFAPDVAVEIRSPGDREANVARKVERYLQYGARVVLDVRPDARTVVAFDARGSHVYTESETFEHPEIDGFRFAVAALFAEIDRRKV
jgi:Uma2 family endonuclease